MKRLFLKLLCVSSVFFSLAFAVDEVNPALKQLLDGNMRYMRGELLHPNRGFSRRFETASRQKPFAIVLGCADSRTPPEIIFDQGLADIFTVRVAGNVLGPVELDSIDYAVLTFGSPIIMVLGHQNCGAVDAVLHNNTQAIEAVAALIQPAVKEANDKLEGAVKMNIEHVVQQLKESKVVQEAIKQGKISVVGGYYHLEDGHVEVLP